MQAHLDHAHRAGSMWMKASAIRREEVRRALRTPPPIREKLKSCSP